MTLKPNAMDSFNRRLSHAEEKICGVEDGSFEMLQFRSKGLNEC